MSTTTPTHTSPLTSEFRLERAHCGYIPAGRICEWLPVYGVLRRHCGLCHIWHNPQATGEHPGVPRPGAPVHSSAADRWALSAFHPPLATRLVAVRVLAGTLRAIARNVPAGTSAYAAMNIPDSDLGEEAWRMTDRVPSD